MYIYDVLVYIRDHFTTDIVSYAYDLSLLNTVDDESTTLVAGAGAGVSAVAVRRPAPSSRTVFRHGLSDGLELRTVRRHDGNAQETVQRHRPRVLVLLPREHGGPGSVAVPGGRVHAGLGRVQYRRRHRGGTDAVRRRQRVLLLRRAGRPRTAQNGRHDVLRVGADGVRRDVQRQRHGRRVGVPLLHGAQPELGSNMRQTRPDRRPRVVEKRRGPDQGQVRRMQVRRHRRVSGRVRAAQTQIRRQGQGRVGFRLTVPGRTGGTNGGRLGGFRSFAHNNVRSKAFFNINTA